MRAQPAGQAALPERMDLHQGSSTGEGADRVTREEREEALSVPGMTFRHQPEENTPGTLMAAL
jgi:hypothetical protein